ncbi:hypothetical protein [Limnohabitans sp. T6-20]|uniref:hypothetical protein n=1 Tax=Limnohabitans sp. T6-20 TaxID=1100725 RepID=UPI000D380B3E|nr:hypothetical protein [Limnohabitans sp. T6-20]PUE07702.1 hypothetical protein B9Z33_12055 [Limnohabitans sp. T6-20]
MSASLPDTPTGREPSRLTNASVPTAPVQASELNRPSAAGATSYKKPGVWIAVALMLGVTFWLYAKPGVVVMLADQLWSCF